MTVAASRGFLTPPPSVMAAIVDHYEHLRVSADEKAPILCPSITGLDGSPYVGKLFENARIRAQRISRCGMRNDLRTVFVDFAVRHSEWTKNAVLHKCSKRLMADDLNNL